MTPSMKQNMRRTNPCHAPQHWQRGKDLPQIWPPGGMAVLVQNKTTIDAFPCTLKTEGV